MLERLRRSVGRRLKAKPFYGDYSADALAVRARSLHFLSDPKFAAAWRASEAANSEAWHGRVPDIRWRAHIACWAGANGLTIEGDFVECGVFTGLLSLTLCRFLDFNATGRSFYLYDTFAGIPLDGLVGEARASAERINASHYFDCYALAARNFAPFPHVRLVRGAVPESLSVAPNRVAYLSLDMNNAPAELAALAFFWDRLTPGAIVLLDDYGWTGAEAQRDAIDRFAAEKGCRIASLPTGQGMLIKPARSRSLPS